MGIQIGNITPAPVGMSKKENLSNIDKSLNKQKKTLHSGLLQAFERSRDYIKNKIHDILHSRGGLANIDELTNIEVEKWGYSEAKSIFYKSYKNFMNSLGLAHITLEEFKAGDSKLDSKAETPWKRYTYIVERGIKIGTRVIKSGSNQIYKVTGITSDLRLILDGVEEQENPINFIDIESFAHFRGQNIKIGDRVKDKKTGKTHLVNGITSMGELRLEGFKNPKNPLNFVK